MSLFYRVTLAGGLKLSRVCKTCGAKIVGTDPTNVSLNYNAHMRLHAQAKATD